MRSEFEKWAMEYSGAVALGDDAFNSSATAKFVVKDLPAAIQAATSASSRFKIEASAGQSKWTHTPWVALLDPSTTASVQEGLYVVYILSADGRRLSLTLNQGCTALKEAIGIPGAREELAHRAASMRTKLGRLPKHLTNVRIDLGSKLWRASLYEAGTIVGVEYDTLHFPDEHRLVADLEEALKLYVAVEIEGDWESEDEMLKDAGAEGLNLTLSEAKTYRWHRSIERQSKNSRTVKKVLGTKCMGCDHDMGDVYGPIGKGVIHTHHLTPLSSLTRGMAVKLTPRTDFAVLCPNCHSIIHRMDDVSDLAGLRALIKRVIVA